MHRRHIRSLLVGVVGLPSASQNSNFIAVIRIYCFVVFDYSRHRLLADDYPWACGASFHQNRLE